MSLSASRTQTYTERVNDALDRYLPPAHQSPARLHEAMRYAVCNGGKRVRPLLVYATGEFLGVGLSQLDAPACAIELIHAYSLVHDDLPAMDDDDLRRGKPTCHKAFDEATAILVGDALQSLAFEILTTQRTIPDSQALQMVSVLAKASGSCGMAGGQALDMANDNKTVTATEIETLYRLKTGALISASVELGILAAQPDEPALKNSLLQFASHLGLAFQIYDDVLDIESDVSVLGKAPGSDQRQQKSTYPAIFGLNNAKTRVQSLVSEATATLSSWAERADYLRFIAQQILSRT